MRDRSKKLLVINTGKKESGQTRLPAQSGTTHIIGGGGLPVNMADYLLKSIWDKVFEIRTDSQGTEYLFGKLPVVTQYGITMYSGDGVDVPSLASGLPFDGRTIWYNPDTQQIEVIGGTGGGSGEGVSNFWDLSGIPSWITNSKPKYTYSEIEGTPDLSKYALASQIPSLSGYATESWVLQKNYATKATTLSGYGITDAYTKTNVDDLLNSYVTLSGSQTITGEKNFTGGLKVNGSPIYYDTEKKYWKLEGDLLVTGGVTMYGSDSSFTPSTIMDALLYDDTTLGINSNGQLYVKGGAGGGLDITALQNYLTQNSYLDVTSGDNRYLKLSGGTLTLENGDSFKIRRNKSNSYGAYIAYETNDGMLGRLGMYRDDIEVYFGSQTAKSHRLLHEGNYSNYALPLSGGTLKGSQNVLIVNRTDMDQPCIAYEYNGTSYGSIGLKGYGDPFVYNGSTKVLSQIYHNGNISTLKTDLGLGSNAYTSTSYLPSSSYTAADILTKLKTVDGSGSGLEADFIGTYKKDSGEKNLIYGTRSDNTNVRRIYDNGWNLMCQNGSNNGVIATLNSNVASATKLNTARTIWGQSFDGTGNVGGTVKTMAGHGLHIAVTDDTYWQSKGIISTSWISGIGDYTDILVPSSASNTAKIRLIKDGNVGIGVDSPSQKLHVGGNVKCNIIYGTNLYANTGGEGLYISGSGIYYHNSSSSWMSDLMYFTSTGNVGIGTTSPEAKLHIVGKLKFTDWDNDGTFLRIENPNKGKAIISIYSADSNAYSVGQDGSRFLISHNVYGDIFNVLNGNVGIGTAHPAYKLEINSSDAMSLKLNSSKTDWGFAYNSIGIYHSNSQKGGLGWNSESASLSNVGFYFKNYVSGDCISLTNEGGIYLIGNVLVSGGLTFYSMRKLKNVVDERGLSLSELSTIKPTRYTWKDGRDNRLHIGGIADDIEQVLPEVVYKTSDGTLTMDYGNAAFAVASSLIQPVVDHEKRIAMLQERIVELEVEVERLKSA